MISIRKFVGCLGVAAGIASVLVLGLSTPTASAGTVESVDSAPVAHDTHTALQALSPACVTAIQAIKTAFANDRAEDAAERAQASLEPDPAADQAEDAAEVARFKALFAAAHTACAASIAAVTKTHTWTSTRSPQCTAAVQAWKAAARALWAQHTRPTAEQLAQLRTLGANARAACGWTWSFSWSWRR